ncbi:hypothetical protein [Clostridium formicaceticum]|uniref:Lipoprotein n=1 Tax=Clostridium formicaceticum TaxID=1497 RepID=A0AAC9WFL3_9CLOT|nr:hypothetical protein [Clostridium formicaceticum]AOY76478.1 hypothetical protein BJL90_11770 [Clostridium formicaceticum]ARE86881.1 hypothetical protein CLFO_12650 [Clostridium formicaceticum]
MKKKVMTLISIFMLSIILTACSVDEEVNKEYVNDYIALNYPTDWSIQVNEPGNNTMILLGKEFNFQFIIDMQITENEDETKKEIEKSLHEGYIKIVEEMVSAEIISYQETTIDGEKAKELKLEIKLLDSTIEQLYYTLNEELSSYNEVKTYLREYEEVEIFINEIKYNPEKLEELEIILLQLEAENEERKPSMMAANAFIGNIHHFIKKEEDILLKQNVIMSYKENIKLNIFFQSDEKEYENNIETVQKVIDSITFIH